MSFNAPQTDTASNKGLLVVLAITVLLTLWTAFSGDHAEDDDVIELAAPQSEVKSAPNKLAHIEHDLRQQTEKPADSLIPWQSLKRELPTTKAQDAFKEHSWQPVVVVKKLKPEPPPAPVAPPAPFVYIGKLEGAPNQATTIFLMSNNKLYSVPIGGKVTPQWQLDAEDANMLRLTYTPLNLTQTLSKLIKAPMNTSPKAAEPTNAEPAAEMNE